MTESTKLRKARDVPSFRGSKKYDLGPVSTTEPLTRTFSRAPTRKVVQSPLDYFDKIWAANGVVYMRNVHGDEKWVEPGDAAEMAQAINRDFTEFVNRPHSSDKATLVRKRDFLVKTFIDAAREAMAQREEPETKEDKLLACAYKGLNRKGEKITSDMMASDSAIHDHVKLYPYLQEADIAAVLRRTDVDPNQATGLLRAMNAKREIEENASLVKDQLIA